MNKSSFTAASTLPNKIITNLAVTTSVIKHNIIPTHVQINPTNKCPLKCSFCSCANRDKGAEMPFETMLAYIDFFRGIGTRAVTITGGGDPLAYPYINEIIQYISECGLQSGLVTNAILINKLEKYRTRHLTWCRISVSDEQKIPNIEGHILEASDVDWSFSYVITKNFNIEHFIECVKFANDHNFSHVRIVNDILADDVFNVEEVQNRMHLYDIDDKLVIYQGRKAYQKGTPRCLISLLKPNIDANGYMMPCCGVQYAKLNPSLDYDKDFVMAKNLNEIEKIYKEKKYFNGSVCERCYYSDYNNVLNTLWTVDDLKHRDFI